MSKMHLPCRTPTTAAAAANNDTLVRRQPALEQDAPQDPLDVADILEARPRKPGPLAHVRLLTVAVAILFRNFHHPMRGFGRLCGRSFTAAV